MIDVLGMSIGDDFIRSNSKKAVIDSGSSFLILSYEGLNSLWGSISGVCSNTYLGVFCPCVTSKNVNLFPNISIWGYGAKFVITPYDYIISSNVKIIMKIF